MVTAAGLEPCIASVKGWCPNHLDDVAILKLIINYKIFGGESGARTLKAFTPTRFQDGPTNQLSQPSVFYKPVTL